jgi:hypothetical protein
VARNRVSFELAQYDRKRELRIDPVVLVYSTYLGGSDYDRTFAIAVDGTGSAYVTGYTQSTNFPTLSPYQATYLGGQDVVVTKLTPSGNALVYSTYLGGAGSDTGAGIAVDAAGSAYVTGWTSSTDFPTLLAYQATRGGSYDAFVTKLAPAGNALVYSTYLGGTSLDQGWAIAVDGVGAAYVTGTTQSTNFPTLSAYQATSHGGFDAFVAKLSPAGTALVYSTYLGGSGDESGQGIGVDAAGSAYVAGWTSSTNFPTHSAYQPANQGEDDVFVTKLTPAGSALVYSTYLGGSDMDDAWGVAVDGAGSAYVTGVTASTNFPTLSAYQATLQGGYDAFVTKLSPAGTALVHSTYLGGSGDDYGEAIAVDAAGSAYVTGYTLSTNFPTQSPYQATLQGNANAFMTKLTPAGNALVHSTYLGGASDDEGWGIAVDGAGAAYVAGQTSSTNFPTQSPYQGTYQGAPYDAFVTKLALSLRFVPVTPCRAVDTRWAAGPLGGPAITPGGTRDFAISASACGIPATAQAFSLNVAVVPSGPLGYLTVWPAGHTRPVVATLNSLDGRIKSNAAIVPAGVGGAISVYSTNTTDVVLDINGYFVDATDPSALEFYPVTPCRVVDTRLLTGPLGGPALSVGQTRTFPIPSSSCGLPSTAQAWSLNFAVVPPGPLGYLTAWPTGLSRPVVATLNALTGAITANAAIVPAGTDGSIDVFTTNATHLVVDINGYFAAPGAGGLSLYNLTPCRVLDTRLPPGTPAFSGTKDVDVTGSPCGAPSQAQAYIFNATVIPAVTLGYLTLWPQGQTKPLVATLNAMDGAITNNMAIVPTTNGSISAFPSNPTHLVLDIFGYFAP